MRRQVRGGKAGCLRRSGEDGEKKNEKRKKKGNKQEMPERRNKQVRSRGKYD